MRRTAFTSALVIAGLPACGDSVDTSPITDVALTDADGSSTHPTTPASSDGSDDDGDGDGTAGASSIADTTGDPGDPTSDASTTGPSPLCGNGVVDPGEACDGPVHQPCVGLDAAFTWGDAACADCNLDTAACQTCQAPAIVPCDPQSKNPLHALELGCPDLEGWTTGNGVPLLDHNFASDDPDAYRVLRRFGSHLLPGDVPAWAPRAGDRMLLLGTSRFFALDLLEALVMLPGAATGGGENANPEAAGSLPPAMHIDMADGSTSDTPFLDCDGVGDCSQTLSFQWLPAPEAHDIAWLDVQIEVPVGTRGYALDLALFTAHFPEYTETSYNDMAILWSQSEAFVGNISHLVVDGVARPFSLPSLAMAGLVSHDGASDPSLLGTGYDGLLGNQGGATDWLTVHGPAVPGEKLTLALALFDLEDAALDSALLVDNFRWRCEPCTLGAPADQGGCGLRPATD